MRKSMILRVAVAALTASAFSMQAGAATTPTQVAAAAAAADRAPAAIQAAPAKVTVAVTGAKTIQAQESLTVWESGKKPTEPSFKALFKLGSEHSNWKITNLIPGLEQSLVILKSDNSSWFMRFGLANEMVTHLSIKTGDAVTLDTQKLGGGALVAFKHGKTPIGFMSSDNVEVTSK